MENKVIVITGSTRGIGFGLADSFLASGNAVVISGRKPEAVERAMAQLAPRYGVERIYGHACDVTDCAQVQALWDAAKDHFGRIDIWINNAGISSPRLDFCEQSPEICEAVVRTNILGAMYGSQIALAGMLAQGFGALYNMEGLGSDGRVFPKMGVYGTSKAALRFLDDTLVQEMKGKPVLVGSIRPGMVLTDMLVGEEARKSADWESNQRVFNILAERVELVTSTLAPRILANRVNGARISYISGGKAFIRFFTVPFKMMSLPRKNKE